MMIACFRKEEIWQQVSRTKRHVTYLHDWVRIYEYPPLNKALKALGSLTNLDLESTRSNNNNWTLWAKRQLISKAIMEVVKWSGLKWGIAR